MTGGGVWQDHFTLRDKISGSACGIQGTGSGMVTGAKEDAIIIDAAAFVRVRGRPQQEAGRIGGRRGASRRHTPQLTAWLPTAIHRGRRYMQILVRPARPGDRGSPALRRGSGQGPLCRVWKAWKVQVRVQVQVRSGYTVAHLVSQVSQSVLLCMPTVPYRLLLSARRRHT